MIHVDTKFFSHLVDCIEMQKNIHLRPYKEKIMWQDKIDRTVEQCKSILDDAIKDEKKAVTRKALSIIPDKSMFDDENVINFDEVIKELNEEG